jgi:hypothetical protein
MNNPNDETADAESTTTESKPKRPYNKRRNSPKILVRVTDDLIETALPKDSEHCMVADAVKVAFPTAKAVSVDLATVRFSDPDKGLRYIYLTPRFAQTALVEFDEGRRPHAFQFELTRAAQIVPIYKRPKGQKGEKRPKPTPVHDLGPQRLQAEGGGRVGTVIGGPSLPTLREPGRVHDISVSEPPPDTAGDGKMSRKRGPRRPKRRREFGIRAFKTGADILISGTA